MKERFSPSMFRTHKPRVFEEMFKRHPCESWTTRWQRGTGREVPERLKNPRKKW